ncbi:MAG: hypothetical protein J1E42_00025 [Akkermansiaceae bacterium]|nr:hypothetical protein [Akkermansiaceae bacterium]
MPRIVPQAPAPCKAFAKIDFSRPTRRRSSLSVNKKAAFLSSASQADAAQHKKTEKNLNTPPQRASNLTTTFKNNQR